MLDRTEIEYQIGEIDRVMPGWVEAAKTHKLNVDICKDELKEIKTQLAEYTAKWADARDYIAHLDELREKYVKALEDLLDEPEAVRVLKHNQNRVNREEDKYTFEDIGQYNLTKKALYTIGCTYHYNDKEHYILLKGNVPESYKEFVYGIPTETILEET